MAALLWTPLLLRLRRSATHASTRTSSSSGSSRGIRTRRSTPRRRSPTSQVSTLGWSTSWVDPRSTTSPPTMSAPGASLRQRHRAQGRRHSRTHCRPSCLVARRSSPVLRKQRQRAVLHRRAPRGRPGQMVCLFRQRCRRRRRGTTRALYSDRRCCRCHHTCRASRRLGPQGRRGLTPPAHPTFSVVAAGSLTNQRRRQSATRVTGRRLR